jgi:hypothetical protein
LPGTAPLLADRQAVYNNKEKGHDRLFREIATEHFSRALDEIVGFFQNGGVCAKIPNPKLIPRS